MTETEGGESRKPGDEPGDAESTADEPPSAGASPDGEVPSFAPDPFAEDTTVPPTAPKRRGFWALTLGSVGVVYGDIGTSPLYALRVALSHVSDGGVTRAEAFGVVSLLLWALILIVSLKYVFFLLRLDNKGEGGVLSLFALVQGATGRRTTLLLTLGIAGAALFYGDAIITPAISVLSAVEGLELVEPVLAPYVIPIAIAILVALFVVQRHGTGLVAALFGPITAFWFLTMGVMGAVHLWQDPEILAAFNPLYAIEYVLAHEIVGLFVLGAIFLAVTGAEALYADLGHFGRKPIRVAWFGLIFPALVLNYLGQGALVLADPSALRNPFFLMAPDWARLPLVILATLATVIAAQAVITGAFSMTRQAAQLGLLPRVRVRHTSETETGQIYVPSVNWLLLGGVVALVLSFGSSTALAAAYGIAVTGTMIVTTSLAVMFLRRGWGWPLALAVGACLPLALVEIVFLVANMMKLPDGGYLPVIVALTLMVVMWTWTRGTAVLREKTRTAFVPLADFMAQIEREPPASVSGTAIFLTAEPHSTPVSLLNNLKHNKVLHEHIVILTVLTVGRPTVDEAERATIERLDDRFERVELRFGFMESPHVSRALRHCRKLGLRFEVMDTSFFLARRKIVADAHYGMPLWQDWIFIALVGLAAGPSDFYHLPRDRVVEIGTQMAV